MTPHNYEYGALQCTSVSKQKNASMQKLQLHLINAKPHYRFFFLQSQLSFGFNLSHFHLLLLILCLYLKLLTSFLSLFSRTLCFLLLLYLPGNSGGGGGFVSPGAGPITLLLNWAFYWTLYNVKGLSLINPLIDTVIVGTSCTVS